MDGRRGRTPVGRPDGDDVRFSLPIVSGIVSPSTFMPVRSQLRLRLHPDRNVTVSVIGAPLPRLSDRGI